MTDLGYDGIYKPFVEGIKPMPTTDIHAVYRAYVMDANCTDPCPACSAPWKREPLTSAKEQVHAPYCDLLLWVAEQDRINDR
jgi:hypothetical protein